MKDPLKAIQAQHGIKPGSGKSHQGPEAALGPAKSKRKPARKGTTERPRAADHEPDMGTQHGMVRGTQHLCSMITGMNMGEEVDFHYHEGPAGDGTGRIITITFRRPC